MTVSFNCCNSCLPASHKRVKNNLAFKSVKLNQSVRQFNWERCGMSYLRCWFCSKCPYAFGKLKKLLVTQTVQNCTYLVQSSPDQGEGLALFVSPLLPNPLWGSPSSRERSLWDSQGRRRRGLRRELASFFVPPEWNPAPVPSCGWRFVGQLTRSPRCM